MSVSDIRYAFNALISSGWSMQNRAARTRAKAMQEELNKITKKSRFNSPAEFLEGCYYPKWRPKTIKQEDTETRLKLLEKYKNRNPS